LLNTQMTGFKNLKNQKGQIGIILVFFVLTILGVVSLSFLYRMRLEKEATSNYWDAIKAEYLALAGIERAIAELKNDKNHYDDLYEDWAKGFEENLGEGYYDVKLLSDDEGVKDVGIVDEASKININVAGDGSFSEGYTPFELNLSSLKELSREKLKAIFRYRYGKDGAPGKRGVDDDRDASFLSKDGIDNDADGKVDEKGEGIDEPDEFCPDSPSGDDNPFETVQEVRLVPGIGEYTFNRIKNYITVYSYDKNIDREGNLRININHAPPSKIFLALKKAGLSEEEAAQVAVNIVDFRDKDSNPTEYRGKYGIEKTPYINEVMPDFTTSVVAAVTDLVKGGVEYLKDKAKKEIRRKIKEKVKRDIPYLDEIIDKATSRGEEELEREVEKIIKRYTEYHHLKKGSGNFLFALPVLFGEKPAFAEGESPVKLDIQIEWIELYNPYSVTLPLPGWRIKTSLGEKKIFGVVPSKGYWVVFNVVIKMPGKSIGREILDNFVDTVKLVNNKGEIVDEATYYNYGVPWRAWEKNDPRVREFAGYIPGGSPWFRNWYWMPEVGEVNLENAQSSFYVKNRPFCCSGEVGYIHNGKQWRTVSLDRDGDWFILDKITTSFPPEKPVKGRININTASKKVLQSLPCIDTKITDQIINYCDGRQGPFDEIGEIARVVGMQKLGINGWDDDGDGYVDEDDEREAILRIISNLITVRSNCFTIVSLGRVIRGGKIVAEKKIKVMVDRGSIPIKILYYREIYSSSS